MSTVDAGSAPASLVPPPTVWPTFRARDARAMIAFLVEAFGFLEVTSHGEGDRVDHAQLAWPPGGGVMLGSERDDGPRVTGPGEFSCYVVCDDPDGLHRRATAAGAVVVAEVTDTDYGSRDVGFADPEGNHWYFGTYRGEPRPTPR
ncbi:MAG: VOC family protein [Kineosporiaceae bacterium]